MDGKRAKRRIQQFLLTKSPSTELCSRCYIQI
jgi:hypothetical protein